MINDVYNCEPEELIEGLNKQDKIGDVLETVISGAFGIGSSFIVDKAIKKVYTPETLPEKILTYLGTAAIGAAVSGASINLVHDMCHPTERAKKQALMNNAIVLSATSSELSRESMNLVRVTQELTDKMLTAFIIPDDISTDSLNTVGDVMKGTDIPLEEPANGSSENE